MLLALTNLLNAQRIRIIINYKNLSNDIFQPKLTESRNG